MLKNLNTLFFTWNVDISDYSTARASVVSNTTKSYTRQRMTSTDNSIFRVLDKLREAVLANKLASDMSWEYDYAESFEAEDAALVLLETRGVIKTIPGNMLLNITADGYPEHKGETTPKDTRQWKRWVKAIDTNAYEKVCMEYDLAPYQETYTATLELIEETVPAVSVGNATYRLPALHSGKATDIIIHCFKNAGSSVSIKELRTDAGIYKPSSISDTIRTSYFARDGLLAPFISSSPTSATLSIQTQLSKEQLASIKAASK